MKQDKWIENVLNSTNGITKVEPNDLVFSKIEKQIQDNNAELNSLSWLVAASVSVFISLSFLIIHLVTFSKNETDFSLKDPFNINNQLYK